MVRKKKLRVESKGDDVPLRVMREQLGLTQLQLAVAIGTDPSSISRWERGAVEPNLTVLQLKKLCRLIGVSVLEELPDYLGRSPADTK